MNVIWDLLGFSAHEPFSWQVPIVWHVWALENLADAASSLHLARPRAGSWDWKTFLYTCRMNMIPTIA